MRKLNILLVGTFAFMLMGFLLKRDVFKELNVVRLSDNIYVDASEITLLSWMEYMQWNIKKYGEDSDAFKNSLPKDALNKKFTVKEAKFVLADAEIRNQPVTGISHKQALEYCNWRSERIEERFGDKINCRLMTKAELSNYKDHFIKSDPKGKNSILNSTEFSEMLAEEGIAFGEAKNGETISIIELSYTEPTESLSFRCVLQAAEE